jgi:hypothetical protein
MCLMIWMTRLKSLIQCCSLLYWCYCTAVTGGLPAPSSHQLMLVERSPVLMSQHSKLASCWASLDLPIYHHFRTCLSSLQNPCKYVAATRKVIRTDTARVILWILPIIEIYYSGAIEVMRVTLSCHTTFSDVVWWGVWISAYVRAFSYKLLSKFWYRSVCLSSLS